MITGDTSGFLVREGIYGVWIRLSWLFWWIILFSPRAVLCPVCTVNDDPCLGRAPCFWMLCSRQRNSGGVGGRGGVLSECHWVWFWGAVLEAQRCFPTQLFSGAGNSPKPAANLESWQQPTRLLHSWDSPGKNTGVGCHFLLQGIFSIQGSNPGLLHCGWILYCLSRQGSP